MPVLTRPLTGAIYRFRPWQDRRNKSLMECDLFTPFKGERPAPAPLHVLDEGEPRTNAPEPRLLAKVFEQSTFNLLSVQKRLEAAHYDEVLFTRYQQTKIRHFHHLPSKWVQAERVAPMN
ncbi:MAG: hypothetical protein OXF31_09380 [Gammaproteobacteria bacterium]|nr:hypothetical protein [Gammaproteobacteria bacterium]